MHQAQETVALERDVIGVLIPAGTRVELPEGANARITQALGGSYTIQVEGHLFRIDGRDADAIGKQVPPAPELPDDADDEAIEKAVWRQMATCFDPEIPVNIVDLGLVYDCWLDDLGDGKRRARVKMTLTAPGCGMGEFLVQDIRSKVTQVPRVTEAEVDLVFDPPWTRDMMSEAAQLQLGMG